MDQKKAIQLPVLPPPNAVRSEDRHDETQGSENAVGGSEPDAHGNARRAKNRWDQHDGCGCDGCNDAIDEYKYEGELLDVAEIGENVQNDVK